MLPYVALSLFSSLRIYALSGSDVPLSILVFILNVMYIVPDIYNDVVSHFVNRPPPYGCNQYLAEDNVYIPLLWTSRGTFLLGETIVLVWTFRKTVRWQSTFPIRMHGSSQMLSEVFLNDGVACFGVPLVLNVITLALTFVETDTAWRVEQCIAIFRDALTTILISRFLLDLAGTGTMRFVSELSASYPESTGSVMRDTTSGDEH
ncbi:hypothetical protein C8Q74DRAFT_1452512 [Fomes fomentarius]|nr:hypothetical protein C8Q74DRAFT_1452512 [Fomes fomentarius]